jgi:transposase
VGEHITTIGLDLGDRYSHYCVLDLEGEIAEEGRVRTTAEALGRWLAKREASRVAIEVGTHSPWVSRLVAECGHVVIVANPSRFRLIWSTPSKTDRLDAERLARVARMDPKLLSPVRHRGSQAQADLAVVKARDGAVRARTLLINQVRGLVKAFGARLPKCSAESFSRKVTGSIPDELGPAVSPMLAAIGTLTREIGAYDRQVERIAMERYPQTKLLQQVAGVGPLTALAYVLTIEDPSRFRKSREVGPYLGLVPRRDASGDRDPKLGITKAGDPALRRLLVQAAHYILGPFGPDTDLRRKGIALAASSGSSGKKLAIVSVARKLAILLHRLWVTGEVYEPLRNATDRDTRAIASA